MHRPHHRAGDRRQAWGGQGVAPAAARRRGCRPGVDGERHHRPGGPDAGTARRVRSVGPPGAASMSSCRSGAPTRRSASAIAMRCRRCAPRPPTASPAGSRRHLAHRLPASDRRKRTPGPARAGPARGRHSGAGQGTRRPVGQTVAAAGRARRAAARAGADAEGTGSTAQDRAADSDGAAAHIAGHGCGERGDRRGSFRAFAV